MTTTGCGAERLDGARGGFAKQMLELGEDPFDPHGPIVVGARGDIALEQEVELCRRVV